MNKILDIELTNGKDRGCVLSLPATDYELLDALERLQMAPDEKPNWEITHMDIFCHLSPFLEGYSLYEINDLSRMLGSMNQVDLAAFEGLLQMACLRGEESTMTDLFTFANSVDLCHVVAEATDDAELGRFYAEYDFVPDLEDLPDSVFEKLDFEKIGKEMRESEKGVFTEQGYAVMTDELRPYTEPVGTIPQAPDYIFRLCLYSRRDPEMTASLDLPASMEQIIQAVEDCGVSTSSFVDYRIEDSAFPGQKDKFEHGSLFDLSELAQAAQYRRMQGELPKLKAILHSLDFQGPDTAAEIAKDMGGYLYEPSMRSAVDIAKERLHVIVGDQELPLLLKHIDLHNYGMDLMEAEKVTMTPYGAVTCQDDEMLLAPEDRPTQGGMEMR